MQIIDKNDLLPLLRQLSSPRGRCNRQAFLHVAVAFIVLQVGCTALLSAFGAQPSGTALFLLNAPILWVGTVVSIKRLHDIGYSGWLMLAAFVGWLSASFLFALLTALILGPAVLAPGSLGYALVFASIVLPAFGGLLWLHTSAGQPVANAFGPVPERFGLSTPEVDALVIADQTVTA